MTKCIFCKYSMTPKLVDTRRFVVCTNAKKINKGLVEINDTCKYGVKR